MIASGSVSGAASRCVSNRDPAAVTVRSSAASSEPRRSPESVRISSRLVRVAASICSVEPEASRAGGESGGRLPSCVRSTYVTQAAAAVSSSREKAPKASVVATAK